MFLKKMPKLYFSVYKINYLEKGKIPANRVITKEFMKESEIDWLPVNMA